MASQISVNDSSCPICLEPFSSDLKTTRLHPEKKLVHIFHEACIDKWFRQNDTCPICRHVSRLGPPPKTPLLERLDEQKVCVFLAVTLGIVIFIATWFFGKYLKCAVPGAPCNAFK